MNEHTENQKDDLFNPNRRLGLLGGLTLFALVVVGLALAIAEEPWNPDKRAERLVENPQNFYGRSTSVRGEVGNVIGSRAFTLNAPDDIGGEVLVISRDPNVPIGGGPNEYLFNTYDQVLVQGEVREFNLREIEQELGTDLVDTSFNAWNNRPVIIADSVERNF